MEQYLGMWSWHSNIPGWFQEGLAVYASGGAGSENVTINDAKNEIISGKTFIPSKSGSLLFKKTAHSFDLSTHMYYRQAGMFVSWLHHSNNEKFEMTMAMIKLGMTLEESMLSAYGVGISESWRNFVNEQKI